MTTVLRKSYKAWSAGTRVEVISPAEGRYPEGVVNPGYYSVRILGTSVDIEPEYLVDLRPRSYLVKTDNRRSRRIGKRRESAILTRLKSESNKG